MNRQKKAKDAMSGNPAANRMAMRQQGVLCEAVASQLWMSLSLPDDISRDEVEASADDLIRAMVYGAGEAAIEQKLKWLQSEQFAMPVNSLVIKQLVRRVCDLVRRTQVGDATHPAAMRKVS